MNDPLQILKMSKNILLVDWPNPGLPRVLLQAGFAVYCFSPNKYTKAEIIPDAPVDINIKNIFPPDKEGDGYLVFRPLPEKPASIDIVYVYRPEEELPEIIAEHVLPLGAKSLWLDPPGMSEAARRIIAESGLILIDNVFIAETTKNLAT